MCFDDPDPRGIIFSKEREKIRQVGGTWRTREDFCGSTFTESYKSSFLS